ncbi:tripartite tricarboxylate transporter TctB family protein [Cypionkella sinensis]|uniref:Tripartite tricarboxylate transporter TctB family protein n=1 Tax=Cypionkella sinensis TaxID=1756043 RepID=A0ABV7IY69_9RHOB
MNQFYTATKRRPNGAAFIIAAILAALGALLIWQGFAIPDKGGYAGIGSGALPKFVGYALLVLAALHIITGLRDAAPAMPRPHWPPVIWTIAGLALQVILLKPLGFSIASALLFACTAAGFGKNKLALTVPIGLALSLLIFGVFDQLLRLKLPAGLLERLIFGG